MEAPQYSRHHHQDASAEIPSGIRFNREIRYRKQQSVSASLGVSEGASMPRFDQQQQQQPSSQQQSKGRQIERTAHVSTSVSRGTMAKATDTLRQVAVEHGGYVAQERSSWSGLEAGATGFSHGWADLTLKVPSNQLNAAIERVRHVGRIVSFRQSSREVTNAFESSDLRSVLSQRDVDSHLALLRSATKDPATNDEQMLQLLAKLTQYEQSVIEEQVTKRRLKDSVEYATIEVHVEELALGTKPNPRNGWQWPSPLSLLSLGLVAVVVLLILRQLYLHRWVVPFVYHAARDTGSTARTAFEVMTQNFAMQMTTSASPQFRPDRGEKEVGEPEKKDDECSSAAAGGSNGTFSHEPAAAFAPSPPQQSS